MGHAFICSANIYCMFTSARHCFGGLEYMNRGVSKIAISVLMELIFWQGNSDNAYHRRYSMTGPILTLWEKDKVEQRAKGTEHTRAGEKAGCIISSVVKVGNVEF